MERSFVLLPADVMATVVDIRSHVTTRQWMEILCNMLTIVAAWNVALSQIMTRSSADADNRLDAFSGQSRSTNMVPFHM